MNKIIIGLALVGMIFLCSCAKDKEIGEIEPLTGDYVLPQGKSPADDRIVELHEKYGSYFLYEFSQRDFNWKFIDISLGENPDPIYTAYSYTAADPAYAGDMLDLLDEIWFRFYPGKEFLKKTIPYRVLMVSTLKKIDLDMEETYDIFFRVDDNQIVFSYCSSVLREMSGERKRELKSELQMSLFANWLETKTINIPKEFYEVSDYFENADEDPESENYARHRGFIASWDSDDIWYEWSTSMFNVDSGETYITYDYNSDLYSYINKMILCTSEEWEEDLNYPLVKQKYDILRNHFKKQYGFDLQAIGDAVYE